MKKISIVLFILYLGCNLGIVLDDDYSLIWTGIAMVILFIFGIIFGYVMGLDEDKD